jgi:hypothetical protein
MRNNFSFLRHVAQHREEITGKAHGNSGYAVRLVDFLGPTQTPFSHSMQADKLCRFYLADRISIVSVCNNNITAEQNRRTSTASREERWPPLLACLRPTYCRSNSSKQGLWPCFFVCVSIRYQFNLKQHIRTACIFGQRSMWFGQRKTVRSYGFHQTRFSARKTLTKAKQANTLSHSQVGKADKI